MASIITSLIPFIIGSAFVPSQIIIIILLLTGKERGLLKAILLVLGITLARLVQGVLFALAFTGGSGDPVDIAHGAPWVKSTALVLLGILLLAAAYKQWANEPDPDAPPPKWMKMFDDLTFVRAFLFGAGLVLISANLWFFTLSALSVIGAAQLGQHDSTIAFLWFVLLAQLLLIIPILIRIFRPSKAGQWLGAFSAWLQGHYRVMAMIGSLLFGLFFLYEGVKSFF